jgi:hypothetical protein
MNATGTDDLVLAVYPNTRGFGFVLFEGVLTPVDWGVVRPHGTEKNGSCLTRFEQMVARQRPDVLVLEDMAVEASRRYARIRDLNQAIAELAAREKILSIQYALARVRDYFAQLSAFTRYARAEFIAQHIPVFGPLLPPPRKIWNSEDPRMSIFDAAALALTFFHRAVEQQFEAA